MNRPDYIINLANNDNQYLIPIVSNSKFDIDIIYNIFYNLSHDEKNTISYIPHVIYKKDNDEYIFINLPFVDSLLDINEEKIITRNFLCFTNPNCVIVVGNENSLEASFNLLFQVMELKNNVIFCINTSSTRDRILIDINLLESELGIPVIFNYIEDNDPTNLLILLNEVSLNKYVYQNNYPLYECNIENVVKSFEVQLQRSIETINTRWLALRIIDNDINFFESISNFLDESCITKLEIIKDSFPKTSNPDRIRSSINKKNLEYSLYLKDKVYYTKDNEGNSLINLTFKDNLILLKRIMLFVLLSLFLFFIP